MTIWVIFFLMMMSLMKNKSEWVKFFCKSIDTEPCNALWTYCYLKPTKLDKMTWQWIKVFFFSHCKKENIFHKLRRTLGIQKKFTATEI